MPEISVIIPNYNHAQYLKQRIDSVLNQTHTDFELIILDDCSPDNSREVIEKYRDHPRVSHIVYNEQNSGSTFKQWKKGLALASGKYIWIAESDDYCEDTLLETLIQPFHERVDLILSYCQSMFVDGEGNNLFVSDWADFLDDRRWKNDHMGSSIQEVNKYLKFRNTIINASAVVFKKPGFEIADDITAMRYNGDWLFWKKMLLSEDGKIAFSAKVLNYFRTHAQNTRQIATAAKEKIRFKEMASFVNIKEYSITDSNYDWMIIWYFERRKAFKNTVNYIIPALPFKMVIRAYLIIGNRIMQKLKNFHAF